MNKAQIKTTLEAATALRNALECATLCDTTLAIMTDKEARKQLEAAKLDFLAEAKNWTEIIGGRLKMVEGKTEEADDEMVDFGELERLGKNTL